MKRIVFGLVLLLGLIGHYGSSEAAPASEFTNFLTTMDSIVAGAAIPLAPESAFTAPAATGQAVQVLSIVKTMLGRPVVWGGATPSQGFDCSGLVQYVYQQAGIDLPRTADLQFLVGRTVARNSLRPGDLVYFTTYAPGASHVGIYVGADKFIHTSFSQGIVAYGDMNDEYFVRRYYGAKRVIL